MTQLKRILYDIKTSGVISAATLIATNGITTGNLNLTGDLYQNGVLFVTGTGGGSSQWGTFGANVGYTGGNVGIGTTSPVYKLDVGGDIYASGDVIAFSDGRNKSNILAINEPLNKVISMRGVYYTNNYNNRRGVGVIAQETESVIPEVVFTDDKGYKSVAYGNISGVLIEAVKELNAKVIELSEEIRSLKSLQRTTEYE